MAMFYLLVLYGLLRAATDGTGLWLAVSVAACALGMATKQVMVSAPIAALLFDRAFLAGSFRQAVRDRAGSPALFSTLGILFALTAASRTDESALGGFGYEGITPLRYALAQTVVLPFYVRQALFPSGLSLDPGLSLAGLAGGALAGLLLVCVAPPCAAWAAWKRPRAGFLPAVFFLVLAPSSSFLPLPDLRFDHRMYLPLAALAAWGVPWLLSHRIAWGWLAAAIACMAALTADRNRDYRSPEAIWASAIVENPRNDRAHYNLGNLNLDARRHASAIASFARSLAVKPDQPKALGNLGNALCRVGRYDEALLRYDQALEADPTYAIAANNKGNALKDLKRFAEAETSYRQAIRIHPAYFNARLNLGSLLLEQGNARAALPEFHECLKLRPGDRPAADQMSRAMDEVLRAHVSDNQHHQNPLVETQSLRGA